MDWLNYFIFICKNACFWCVTCCVSEWINMVWTDFTYKYPIIHNREYWQNFIDSAPYIVDLNQEKFFYAPPSEWNYFEDSERIYVQDQICKDLILRKYLLDSGYTSPYKNRILTQYINYAEKIQLYKKMHNII